MTDVTDISEVKWLAFVNDDASFGQLQALDERNDTPEVDLHRGDINAALNI